MLNNYKLNHLYLKLGRQVYVAFFCALMACQKCVIKFASLDLHLVAPDPCV